MEKGTETAKIVFFSIKTRSSFHTVAFLFPILTLVSRFIRLRKKILHKRPCRKLLHPYTSLTRALPGSIPRCPLYHDSKEGWDKPMGSPESASFLGEGAATERMKKPAL